MSLATLNLTRSTHWKFQGIHFTRNSALLGNTDVTLTHNLHESGQLKLSASDVLNYGTVVPNANVTIDHDEFTNYQEEDGGHEGRLELYGSVAAGQQRVPDGFTIQYSYFHGGYPNSCSDGIQMVAETSGAVIRYNEFANMPQGACAQEHPAQAPHVDPIQSVGDNDVTITGNYFHNMGDGSGGIEFFDGCNATVVTNNVVVGSSYARSISLGYSDPCSNATVKHNVLGNLLSLGQSGDSGNVATDNVMDGFYVGEKFGVTDNYNLCTVNNGTCTGAQGLLNTPVYEGGAAPSGYYGWALASNSPGYHAASDGKSMGIAP